MYKKITPRTLLGSDFFLLLAELPLYEIFPSERYR